MQTCENDSFRTTSADNIQLYTDWAMGPSSASLNDIGRDDFHEVLHIDEDDEDDVNTALTGSQSQSVIDIDDDSELTTKTTLRSSNSEESISSMLDSV